MGRETFHNWVSSAWTICALIVAIASLSASFALAQYRIGEADAERQALRQNAQADHDLLIIVRNDVAWIRRSIEELKRAGAKP